MLTTHVLGYLLLGVIANPTFIELCNWSTKIYWPTFVVIQILGLSSSPGNILTIIMMLVAALFEWWIIFCTVIWTVRLYFQEPPISKQARIAIPILALAVAACFCKVIIEDLRVSKYQHFRYDVSEGRVHRVEEAIRTNPEFVKQVQSSWGTALHEAAQSGRTNTAELLLKNGSDIDARNGDGATPLHVASRGGRIEAARLLIAYKADVNATNHDGLTPLWYAATGGKTNLIELLLENGAILNAQDKSPLLGAIMNNQYGVVPLLLSHGANPIGVGGETMLDRAAIQGSPELAEALLPYFKDANSRKHLSNAFSTAFQCGHMDVAIPISVSALRFESNSVHEAAFRGDVDAVRARISSQPELLNSKDFLGLTPLHRAAQAGKDNVVELLLSKGATIDPTDPNDNTPLHWAVFSRQSNVMRTLIADKANLNIKGAGEKTALHLAIQQGFLPLSQMLLDAGADPNIATKYNETPLCIAVMSGDVEAVKLLQTHHASFDINFYNDALFHVWAVGSANTEIADLLLANGCNVNAKGRDGRRPLHALLEQIRFQGDQKGQMEAVQWLLSHKVEVNVRNDKGETPLSLLKWRNRGRTFERRKDIGDLLRSHGARE